MNRRLSLLCLTCATALVLLVACAAPTAPAETGSQAAEPAADQSAGESAASGGTLVVALPLELALKLSLYWEMTARGMQPSELALDLGVSMDGLEAIFSADERVNQRPYAKRAAAMALAEVEARNNP
ncbi:MAG: hypothetical protein HC802_10060, partial [Caldilineaceae bacterium]|nr:hypothetical protein [Caldilineaceae bacterium]